MPVRRHATRLVLALLAGALALPAGVTAGSHEPTARAAPSSRAPAPPGGLRSSIHYEDALAHAKDHPSFPAGDRVTVPFRPRPNDRRLVGGIAPRALPAGLVSGRDLRARSPEPSTAESSPSGSAEPIEATPAPPSGPPPADDPAGPVEAGEGSARVDSSVERASALTVAVDQGLYREVYGFLPYWELGDAVLDQRALTTIAYFGVGASASGDLVTRNDDGSVASGWAGWTSARMTSLINAAHLAGTRVVLTVERFSWSTSGKDETVALLSSSTARVRLARQIAGAVRDRGADGVNLDFEPIPSGQTENFTLFVRRVRTELDAIAPGYQLVFDATGWIGGYDISALTALGAADAVFVMGYDYRTGGAATAGSVAPLAGPLYDITDTVNAYLSRTAPSKVILGVPYYGRAWPTTSDALNSATRPQGSTYGYSTSAVYTTAIGLAASYGKRYDTAEQVAWTAYQRRACASCPLSWRELYFDDERALAAKYDLVNARGLRGAGIWALGYEGNRTELSMLLRVKFGEDGTPPAAGIRALPETSVDEGIPVAWTARDDLTGVAAYDLQVSLDGGAWQGWLSGTTLVKATYLGVSGHGYAFRVRARDGKGNWSSWVDQRWFADPSLSVGGFGRVVATSLGIRTGPTVSATKLGTLANGDVVALIDGPVAADGYSWYRVLAPIREWRPVSTATYEDVWVAAGTTTTDFLAAAQAPNATSVSALITGFSAGAVGTLLDGTTEGDGARAFSPNGDGFLDVLRLRYELDRAVDAVSLRAYRASDRSLIGTLEMPGVSGGAHAFDWNGMLSSGRVPDGRVLVQLRAVDEGASYSAPAADMADPTLDLTDVTIRVDTTPPRVTRAAIAPDHFSPNGDGVLDSAVLEVEGTTDAVSWRARLLGPDGSLRDWAGSGPSARITWDGRDARGVRVADGPYAMRVTMLDALGNRVSATRSVTVDTVAPTGTLSIAVDDPAEGATPNMFSPDADGVGDRVDFRWRLSEWSGATVRIRVGDRLVYRATTRWGGSGQLTWRGQDAEGQQVPDGRYDVLLSARDRAGNRRELAGSVVVARTAGYLTVTPWLWHPSDRDDLADSARFRFRLTASATTSLVVLNGWGRVVRTVWTGRLLGAGDHDRGWWGRLDDGTVARAGQYRVRLTATRGGVTQVLGRNFRLGAFAIFTSTATLRAGQTVRVIARSAEPLAGPPRFSLSQPDGSRQEVLGWHRLDGRWQADLTVRSSEGPATITVRGTDIDGGANRSSLTLPVLPAPGI